MKILWFVNNVFPDAAKLAGIRVQNNGWWLCALAGQLQRRADVELTVVTETPLVTADVSGVVDGVRYVLLPAPWRAKVRRSFGLLGWDSLIRRCQEEVSRWRPDVVVVHGTEHGYGLAAPCLGVPVIVSLQGILNPYYPHYWGELKGSLRRFLYPLSVFGSLYYRQRMPMERDIISANRHFLGRTDWDRAHMRAFRPDGTYHHEPRVLRPEFYRTQWNLADAERGRIYTTTTPSFLKGTPCLIEAFALLLKTHPYAKLVIGGNIGKGGVGGYIRRKARRLGVSDSIEYLGYLSGDEIVENLRRAHVYAIPSHIENSPNNLAEAQAVGVPCVASYAGGIPSMVDHGRTGLLFNVGDAPMLADRLRAVLDDDGLARAISVESRRETAQRHDPGAVTAAHLAACRAVLASAKP